MRYPSGSKRSDLAPLQIADVPNHHQLWLYKPVTFAGSTHKVNYVPYTCHLPGKVGILTRHWRWHAANWPWSGSATSVPTPSGDGCGWQSTWISLWVYRHGSHGTSQLLVVFRPAHCKVKAQSLMKRSCWTTLNKARSWRGVVFRGTSVDLLGTKVPVAAFLLRMWLTVALCRMPSQGSASTSCLIPIGLSPCHSGGCFHHYPFCLHPRPQPPHH